MNKRRYGLEITILVLFAIFIIFLVIFININLVNQLLKSKNEIIDEIEKIIGVNIEYKKFSPDIIGSIKVNEVMISDETGLKFEIGNVYFNYSLLSFFQNPNNKLSIIKKVSIKKVDLQFELTDFVEKIKDIQDKIAVSRKQKNDKNPLLEIEDLKFEVPYFNLMITDKNNQYQLFIKKYKMHFADEKILINFISHISFILEKAAIIGETDLKLDGYLQVAEKDFVSDINLQLQQMMVNQKKMINHQFHFKSHNTDFSFQRIKDQLPILFELNKTNKKISTNIEIKELITTDLFIKQEKFNYFPDFITFKNQFDFQMDNRILNGTLSFQTFFNQFLLFKQCELNSQIDIKDNQISIDYLTFFNNNRAGKLNINGKIPLNLQEIQLVGEAVDFSVNKFKINTIIHFQKKQLSNTNNFLHQLSADYFLLNGYNMGDLHYQMLKKDSELTIKTLKSFNGYIVNGYIKGKKDNREINLLHQLDNFTLLPVIKAFQPLYTNNIFLQGSGTTTLKNNQFSLSQSKIDLIQNNNEVLSFVPSVYNQKIIINDLKVMKKSYTGKTNIYLYGQQEAENKPSIYINSHIENDSFFLLSQAYFYQDMIKIKVNEYLNIQFDKEKKSLQFVAKDFKVPIKKNPLRASFDFYYDLNTQQIQPFNLSLDNIKLFREKTGNLKANIHLKDRQINIKNIAYHDQINHIVGSFVSNIQIEDQLQLQGDFFLKDDQKTESYSGNFFIRNGKIQSKIFITHFDINKILPSRLGGFLNLRMLLNGNIKNPDIAIEGNLAKGTLGNNHLTAQLNVKKIENQIFIEHLKMGINHNYYEVRDSEITLSQSKKRFEVFSHLYLNELNKKVETDLQFSGYFTNFKNFNIDVLLSNSSIEYQAWGKTFKSETFQPQKFNINYYQDLLIAKNYGERFFYLTKYQDSLTIKLLKDYKNIFMVEANTENGNLKGTADFYDFPINLLVYKLLYPMIGIEQGYLNGQLQLSGKIKEPEYYGKLKLYYGRVLLDNYLDLPITNITGIIIAEKNKFFVNSVNGMNGKNGKANGWGEIVFNGWKLDYYDFKVTSNSVPAHFNQGPIDAKGKGYVNEFIFQGKPKNFNFLADIVVTDGIVNIKLFQQNDPDFIPPKIPVNVIINFTAGNRVIVNYPLVSGQVNEGEKLLLKYFGNEPAFYLGGEVALNKGQINYLNNTFKIEKALVQFDEMSSEVNPYLNIKSFFRTKNAGERIKLYLDINGPLMSFKTNFYSVPYRNENVVNSILGLSTAANNDTQSDIDYPTNNVSSLQPITDTTNYIGNTLLLSPLENSIQRTTALDTFSLNTSLFGNLFENRSSNNIYDLLDETSITIGKYIFDGIYFESLMTFNKKNDINDQLFLAFPDQNFGLNLELMLQLDMPFFSLGYKFAPWDFYNFSNADHIITLESSFNF
ncbi:MAG: translocation/assembly module TamB [Spirochaetes bacterium]|nr:translocation/assembly module TamB [Spirochaetota bacterium]